MQIEIKKDEKGKPIFCVGKFIFYSFEDAEKKLRELKKEEAKKKKAEKTDLGEKIDRSMKEKAETNNETNEETKNNVRNH